MDETAGQRPDSAGEILFGYRFGIDHDGSPNVTESQGRWDAFTFWLDDNSYPSDIAEHLAAIDDVVDGRRVSYDM